MIRFSHCVFPMQSTPVISTTLGDKKIGAYNRWCLYWVINWRFSYSWGQKIRCLQRESTVYAKFPHRVFFYQYSQFHFPYQKIFSRIFPNKKSKFYFPYQKISNPIFPNQKFSNYNPAIKFPYSRIIKWLIAIEH
jgi:hypothetical protein